MVILSTFRQMRFPREFRVAASPWPADLEQLLSRVARPAEAPGQPQGAVSGEPDARLLASIGTGLWRLRRKMEKPGTDQPLETMRLPYRHLESVWDVLVQSGTDIQDHTDTPFDPGMSLKVVAYQPTPGLTRERVIETIKPSIYFKGKRIQMGEVIVGTPEPSETSPGR
ncbi:MAG: hypothetical protein A2Y76_14985 [Planctomycetes bacterium RBG_13_60_9]|nr:MAG: hypothetical protein A2Y76_14985 [Planctomycetes bacterium RBG_13_60_9]